MTYNKPEVVNLAILIKVVQGTKKQAPHAIEMLNNPNKPGFTIGAYEADE